MIKHTLVWDKTVGLGVALLALACGGTHVGSAEVSVRINTPPELCIKANQFIVHEGLHPTPRDLPVGDTVDVVVEASDADGDPLSFAYTSSCANASFTPAGTGPTPNITRFYNADPTADCTIEVAVFDGRGGTTRATVYVSGS